MTNFGDVGRIYREVLSKVGDSSYSHVRVSNEHVLYTDGHVKRSVTLLVEAIEANVEQVFWRVPIVNPDSKVTGVKVFPNKEVRSYVLKEEENTRVIEITVEPMKVGSKIQLQFEYYVTHACQVVKNGIFYKELKYPFAYKPTSKTESFEFRLNLPLTAELEIVSNLPSPEKFRLGNNQLIIANEEEFSSGDIFGDAVIKFRTSAYVPLISILLGSISTLLLAIIRYGDNYIGASHLLLIPVVLSVLFFAAFKFLRVE